MLRFESRVEYLGKRSSICKKPALHDLHHQMDVVGNRGVQTPTVALLQVLPCGRTGSYAALCIDEEQRVNITSLP